MRNNIIAYNTSVSIHASAWEATQIGSIRRSGMELFQSTPPHGRRRGVLSGSTVQIVSIHASAWEATVPYIGLARRIVVSIHASAWEATAAL